MSQSDPQRYDDLDTILNHLDADAYWRVIDNSRPGEPLSWDKLEEKERASLKAHLGHEPIFPPSGIFQPNPKPGKRVLQGF